MSAPQPPSQSERHFFVSNTPTASLPSGPDASCGVCGRRYDDPAHSTEASIPDRVVTFPADAVQRLADRLQDENWHMDGDTAREIAQEIVIEVTEAVDRLRAIEAQEASGGN